MWFQNSILFLVLNLLVVNGGLWDVFEYIVDNAQGPISGNSEDSDPVTYRSDVEGSYKCAALAGCTTITNLKCSGDPNVYGNSMGCENCYYGRNTYPHPQVVMRADHYQIDEEYLKSCSDNNLDNKCPIKYVPTILQDLYLKGFSVANTFQGASFRHRMPQNIEYRNHYNTKFCEQICVQRLKVICGQPTIVSHVADWCYAAVKLIEKELPNLTGPPSFIMLLAAKIGDIHSSHLTTPVGNDWPESNKVNQYEEKAVLIASAAMSVLLTGHWWKDVDINTFPRFKDFGFAIQHSLMLAIFDGRLRITLENRMPGENSNQISGSTVLCDSNMATEITDNFEGAIGTVYAALCSTFYQTENQALLNSRKLRIKSEIHVPTGNYKCVEKKTGMVFIRPGDWFPQSVNNVIIGSTSVPLGLAFIDKATDLTTIEIKPNGDVTLYPPSIGVVISKNEETACKDAKGNGPLELLNEAGIRSVGGICNWLPAW